MSYQIICVDRRWNPLVNLNGHRITRSKVKTVDTETEAMDYCVNRNVSVGSHYMGKDVYHYFERIGDEEE